MRIEEKNALDYFVKFQSVGSGLYKTYINDQYVGLFDSDDNNDLIKLKKKFNEGLDKILEKP